MADYIKREDALERIDGIWDCADMVFEPNDHCCNMDDCASCKWRETKDAIRKIVAHTPAADVRPVVRGRWIESYNKWIPTKKCSVCNTQFTQMAAKVLAVGEPNMPIVLNYCPNCGAMMDGEGTDAT